MQHVLDAVIYTIEKMKIKQNCSPWSLDADMTVAQHKRSLATLYRALKSGDWTKYRRSRNKVTVLT